jgi:hypothetical protein
MFLELISAFFLFMLFLCLLYSIPILLIRRFRHRHNVLTLNICFAVTLCAVYHIIYMMLVYQWKIVFSKFFCHLTEYIRMMVVCQMSYAFITVTIHRFCSIVYFTKPLFKKSQWLAACLACQWIIACIISIPYWPDDHPVCIRCFDRTIEIFFEIFISRSVHFHNGR